MANDKSRTGRDPKTSQKPQKHKFPSCHTCYSYRTRHRILPFAHQFLRCDARWKYKCEWCSGQRDSGRRTRSQEQGQARTRSRPSRHSAWLFRTYRIHQPLQAHEKLESLKTRRPRKYHPISNNTSPRADQKETHFPTSKAPTRYEMYLAGLEVSFS